MAATHTSASTTGWSPKTVKTYVLGFILCLLLTICSFGIVYTGAVSHRMIYIILTLSALAQLFIQAVCFLGLKSDTDGQWNLLPFLFTLMIIFFLVGGSLWIMYNLNTLMMTEPFGV